MNDLDALMQALVEEIVRRKKTEAALLQMSQANEALTTEIAALKAKYEPPPKEEKEP